MSPRHDLATATELARIGLFGSLPGQTLGRIATELDRTEHAPGSTVDATDRFVVVIRGMASAGARMLRPGDVVDPGSATTVRPVTPLTIASCDRETYERAIKPELARG